MYFQPPTLDPGPVATVVALVLLAHCVVSPPLARSRAAARCRRGTGPHTTHHAESLRTGAWFLLFELLLVMAFVGTADGVSVADLGWSAPAPGDLPEPVLALAGTVLVGGFLAHLLTLARSNGALLRRVRSGRPLPEEDWYRVLRLPGDRRGFRALAVGRALVVLSDVLVVYTVLLPMMTLAFDSVPFVVTVLTLLLGWRHVGGGGETLWTQTLLALLGLLLYTLVLPGSVWGPVLVGAAHWAVVLATQRALVGLPVPGRARPLPEVRVTMLDADGKPVERPGGRAPGR
ncbi:hypothetical protein KGD82_14580 [Nocardiopsis eucommiae]|uniref:Uncharacterized protein n=1 Tax=Nocardiopsis eucommiae TaxID=2831970 RepID=A0A975L6G9_9ACTN|nr:hypothetical protein KGD82_14580 [Nocardiopsis eucommiae]